MIMKISTWNLMRPNSKTVERNTIFCDTLTKTDSDILILTETNSLIDFGDKYFTVSTKPLPETHDGYLYQTGENRTTIYSKFPFIRQIPTSDIYTSVCAEASTPFGPLIIYGTIIGISGGKDDRFKNDLKGQTSDLTQLIQQGNLCLSGDLNVSFSGYTYPSQEIRKKVQDFFSSHSLTNLTGHFQDSAIHTVISSSFLRNRKIDKTRMLFDKKITDHNLVTVTLATTV